MTKTKKILSIIIASIVALIIAFAVLIKIYVTPERVKAFLIPAAEKKLNRKIDVSEIKISLLGDIEVKDFALKEKDQKTDFIKCKDFVLKYKLLPLLSKKIIIDELKLLSPEVKIERNAEGKFNFEDIGPVRQVGQEKKSAVTENTKRPEEKKQPPESKELPVSLLINRVVIADANFSFLDLKKEFPDIKGSFTLGMDLKSADGAGLSSSGDLDLKLNDVTIKKPSVKHVRDINVLLGYTVYTDLKLKEIRIDKANLKIQGIPVSITGKVANFKDSPKFDITVSIPKTKIADIQKVALLYADIKGLTLSGDISADLKLSGMSKKLDTLKTDGVVKLEKTGIVFNGINTVLDGNLKFNKQKMDIDFDCSVGKNTVELKGSIYNYLKNQQIKLNLYSKQLFLNELIPAGVGKNKTSTPDTAKVSTSDKRTEDAKRPEEARPLNLGLTAEGEIKIDNAVYKGMSMSDFYTKYQLKNNIFEIIMMSAKAGKGEFNLNSTADLSKPGYTYKLSCGLDSLHADEIVNSFFPKAKGTVFGFISANLKLNGSGTLPESIKRNLTADGDFNIKDGKITNNKLAEKFALFLSIDELKTINLKQANGTLRIRNGIARLDSIFSSDDISMNPSGNIGLNETLDLEFDLKLSPRLTDKALRNASIASYIKDDAGWGRIPIKISGTFSNPSYRVDIGKAGRRIIEKKAKDVLKDIFNKNSDRQKEQQPQDNKPPQQEDKRPVEEIFKDLFK